MSKDEASKIAGLVPLFSELQQKILWHIGTTNNASYRTLVKEIGRDRITILQSVESLIEHYHYIEKRKINPKYQKSRLIFMLTHKGIAAAWLRGIINTDDISKNLNRDDNITKYIKFIHDVFDPLQYKQMLETMFSKLEWTYAGYEGEEESDDVKKLIRECFLKGILELAVGNNYNVNKLFSDNAIGWLKRLFSSEELKEFKKFFIQGRKNLNSTIERFPD